VTEAVHRAANQALAVAVHDLGLAGHATHRTVRFFEVDDGTNAGTFSRHFLGYVADERLANELCPTEPGARLRGFVLSAFGQHRDLWIRKTHNPAQAAATVLHEAAHSFQVGQGWSSRSLDRETSEADARAYAARMLANVTVLPRASAAERWELVF
jgi:hypothetical protein